MIDLLFVAFNRLEFTREALAALKQNTNWDLVNRCFVYDDGSTDGTVDFLKEETADEVIQTRLGSPIAITNDFLSRSTAPMVAKIDNDAVVPPGWLDLALDIMEKQPEVDCLGLEHRGLGGEVPHRAVPTDHIGGLYVAHRKVFDHEDLPVPNGIYSGWQEYQRKHNLNRCWIAPSIPVFLLDRVPDEPYASLSRKYEAAKWQRFVPFWHYRPEQSALWTWWTERTKKV